MDKECWIGVVFMYLHIYSHPTICSQHILEFQSSSASHGSTIWIICRGPLSPCSNITTWVIFIHADKLVHHYKTTLQWSLGIHSTESLELLCVGQARRMRVKSLPWKCPTSLCHGAWIMEWDQTLCDQMKGSLWTSSFIFEKRPWTPMSSTPWQFCWWSRTSLWSSHIQTLQTSCTPILSASSTLLVWVQCPFAIPSIKEEVHHLDSALASTKEYSWPLPMGMD